MRNSLDAASSTREKTFAEFWKSFVERELIYLVATGLALSAAAYVFNLGQFTVLDQRFQSYFSFSDRISNVAPLLPRLVTVFTFGFSIFLFFSYVHGECKSIKWYRKFIQLLQSPIIILIVPAVLFICRVNILSYNIEKLVLAIASMVFFAIHIFCRFEKISSSKFISREYLSALWFASSLVSGIMATYVAGISDMLYKLDIYSKSNVCYIAENGPEKVGILFSSGKGVILFDGSKMFFLDEKNAQKLYFLPPKDEVIASGELRILKRIVPLPRPMIKPADIC